MNNSSVTITPTPVTQRELAPKPFFPTSGVNQIEEPIGSSPIMGVLTFQKDPRETLQEATEKADPNSTWEHFSEATGMPLPTLKKAA